MSLKPLLKLAIRSIEENLLSYPSTTRCKKPFQILVVENFNKLAISFLIYLLSSFIKERERILQK